MSTALADLLSGFAEKYGLTDLEEDEGGYTTLFIDDRKLQVFESLGKVYLSAQVQQMPAQDFHRIDMLKTALKASLVNALGYRVSLYLNESKDSLCLYQSIQSDELDLLAFESLIEKFMYALDGFSEFIAQRSQASNKPRLFGI